MLFLILVTLAATAVAACLAGLMLVAGAPRLGLLDNPNIARKAHAAPTPAVGGLAIAAAAAVAWVLMPSAAPPPGALISFAMLLALGVVDDRSDVHWSLRFLGQAIALLPMILIDGVVVHSLGALFGGHPLLLGPLAIPLTVFMGLGAINALNMIDGADGLATSLGLTALLLTAVVAGLSGQTGLALTLVTMAAALVGFLALNLRTLWQPRALAFLGNGGSELLGLVLAWAVIRLTQAPHGAVAPVLAPFLIGPALLDCVAVMSRRLLAGRSPFRADSQHFHHILLRAGLPVSGVVGAAVGGALLFGLVPMLGWQLGMTETALALLLIAALVAYVGWQQFMAARFLGGLGERRASAAACPAE